MTPRFDLQCHSTHSDGTLAPGAVMGCAARSGIELVALTDHDTVDGVEEARSTAAGLGLRCIPAIELSAVDGEHEDLHLCGYGVDVSDPVFLETLREFRADRGRRIWAMAERLRIAGTAVDEGALRAREALGRPLGRPHLARAIDSDLSIDELFARHLVPGTPTYVARTFPTVDEAIAVIHAAGGLAVWAHPFWDIIEREQVAAGLARFAAAGLDGVEAFYVTHTREQTEWLHARALEMGLLTTGSSDFHGPEHARFGRFGAFDMHGLEPRLGALLSG